MSRRKNPGGERHQYKGCPGRISCFGAAPNVGSIYFVMCAGYRRRGTQPARVHTPFFCFVFFVSKARVPNHQGCQHFTAVVYRNINYPLSSARVGFIFLRKTITPGVTQRLGGDPLKISKINPGYALPWLALAPPPPPANKRSDFSDIYSISVQQHQEQQQQQTIDNCQKEYCRLFGVPHGGERLFCD